MSSESVGANEFPDVVGVQAAKSDENPLLATFRPYIPANVHVRELTVLPLVVGTTIRMTFRGETRSTVRVPGMTTEDGHYRDAMTVMVAVRNRS